MSSPAETHFYTEPAFWISVVSVCLAGWSAYNSWRSRHLSARALSISEKQEDRRQPRLEIYLADGYRTQLPNKKIFGFMISVMNPSDINNSIAIAELRVGYLIGEDNKAVCRLPHNPGFANRDSGSPSSSANIFSIPARVDAHQTVSGWLFFAIENSVLGGGSIDSHTICLTDSHGTVTETEPIALREWINETPKD